jgi:hypothetical protein
MLRFNFPVIRISVPYETRDDTPTVTFNRTFKRETTIILVLCNVTQFWGMPVELSHWAHSYIWTVFCTPCFTGKWTLKDEQLMFTHYICLFHRPVSIVPTIAKLFLSMNYIVIISGTMTQIWNEDIILAGRVTQVSRLSRIRLKILGARSVTKASYIRR